MATLNSVGKMLRNFTTEIEYQGHNLVVAGTFAPVMATAGWDQPDDPAEVEVETILLGETDVTELFGVLFETMTMDTKTMKIRSAIDAVTDIVFQKLEL